MSDVVIASNQSLKVNRAISGATTVSANCYAIVTYLFSGYTPTVNAQNTPPSTAINRYFGPSQAIPSSFTANNFSFGSDGYGVCTYSLQSGVEFINSP
mgnify:CR=1 FL=1